MRTEATDSKVEQYRDTTVTDVTASSLAKETRNSSIAGANKAFSDEGS